MQYEIINAAQGSQEWLNARKDCFTSCEAPNMMGVGKYKTRQALLHEKATGLTKEVDANTQRLFDRGHATEALARVIAEKMIGEELYPITAKLTVDGFPLLASLDGLTMDNKIAFEHKLLSESLKEQVLAKQLEPHYTAQLDQILLVTGADKVLFVTSDGTEENFYSMWYETTDEKKTALLNAWAQFAKDLENYEPPVQVEKVVAETVEALPVPSVVVRGEITASNITEITPKFDNYLANIKTELSTDQDFADAEANAKNCEDTEKRIQALRENIIAQMVSVNEVDSALSNYQEAFRKMKVLLKNAVKEQKDTIKTNAILKAKQEYSNFVSALNKELPFSLVTKLIPPNFSEAIKNVKTIASMQSRLNDAVANGKAEATTLANDVQTKLAYIDEAGKGYEHLINKWELAFKELDYIKLNIQSVKDAEDKRKAEHEARIKAQAEADARAKIEAEQRAKEEAEKQKLVPPAEVISVQKQINEAKPEVIKSESATAQDQVDENKSSLTLNILKKAQPSAIEIVDLVAKHYMVSKEIASDWLAQTDFQHMRKVA